MVERLPRSVGVRHGLVPPAPRGFGRAVLCRRACQRGRHAQQQLPVRRCSNRPKVPGEIDQLPLFDNVAGRDRRLEALKKLPDVPIERGREREQPRRADPVDPGFVLGLLLIGDPDQLAEYALRQPSSHAQIAHARANVA